MALPYWSPLGLLLAQWHSRGLLLTQWHFQTHCTFLGLFTRSTGTLYRWNCLPLALAPSRRNALDFRHSTSMCVVIGPLGQQKHNVSTAPSTAWDDVVCVCVLNRVALLIACALKITRASSFHCSLPPARSPRQHSKPRDPRVDLLLLLLQHIHTSSSSKFTRALHMSISIDVASSQSLYIRICVSVVCR